MNDEMSSRSGFVDHHAALQVVQIRNTVQGRAKLFEFLSAVVPDEVPYGRNGTRTQGKEDLLQDVLDGVDAATMSVRITFVSTLFLPSPAPMCTGSE